MNVKKKVFLSILMGVLTIAGCSSQMDNGKASKQETNNQVKTAEKFEIVPATNKKLGQIRGIGYPGNDDALYVATDNGIKFYKNSKWSETSTNNHNYMSFQAVDTGYLASGHPQKGTGLKDPLGLVESTNRGKSFKKLAFYGAANFHFLSASYTGNGKYIIIEQPTNKLDPGLYYSPQNNGELWIKSKLVGFTADSLGMIAVNPKDGNIMAMSTRNGVYYSENYSNTMKAVTAPVMVTALTFSGDNIIYSSVEDNKILLKKVNPKTGEQTDIVFPYLDYDNPVTYLTVDPKNEKKIAFATYKNDLYESTDGGKNWNNLVEN